MTRILAGAKRVLIAPSAALAIFVTACVGSGGVGQEPSSDELVALGEELYQHTAGEIGCASCHGADAFGGVGPNLRGVVTPTILEQAHGNDATTSIVLSQQQAAAIETYVDFLHHAHDHLLAPQEYRELQ